MGAPEEGSGTRDTSDSGRFLITAGTSVIVQRAGNDLRVPAEVLGAVRSRYIALRHTSNTAAKRSIESLDLRVEDTVILRFVHDGVVYGFRTVVSRLTSEPEYLAFVSYPRAVERVSVRRRPRLSCRMPCLAACDGGDARPAVLVDVSAAGCGVVGVLDPSVGAPAQDTTVTIRLSLPEHSTHLDIAGQVQRSSSGDTTWQIGILFEQEHAELFSVLQRYLQPGETS